VTDYTFKVSIVRHTNTVGCVALLVVFKLSGLGLSPKLYLSRIETRACGVALEQTAYHAM
jgi:hypothetical protein